MRQRRPQLSTGPLEGALQATPLLLRCEPFRGQAKHRLIPSQQRAQNGPLDVEGVGCSGHKGFPAARAKGCLKRGKARSHRLGDGLGPAPGPQPFHHFRGLPPF